jgi:hypothetical protein
LKVGGATVRRRDLFDAKFQLLAEGAEADEDLESVSDLSKGRYEGGERTVLPRP